MNLALYNPLILKEKKVDITIGIHRNESLRSKQDYF